MNYGEKEKIITSLSNLKKVTRTTLDRRRHQLYLWRHNKHFP